MAERQFCPACPAGPNGQWVEVEGHEHPLPTVKPEVYLYNTEPTEYAAYLPILTDDNWKGWRAFPTLPEAMDYARTLAVTPTENGENTHE